MELICKTLYNPFWKDVLVAYKNFVENIKICTIEQFINVPLFYNHNILMANKPVYIRNMYDNNVCFIKDIMYKNGTFIGPERLQQMIGRQVNFLLYEGLKKAVKAYLNTMNIKCNDSNTVLPAVPAYLEPNILCSKGTASIYRHFIRTDTMPTCQEK